MSDRIQSIQKMLEKGEDVFLRYSLGMEYASEKRHDLAVQEFRKCIELDESYLAAYVEAGKSLRSAGQLGQAREVFAEGMELAAREGESHMRDFIQQQLDALPKQEDG